MLCDLNKKPIAHLHHLIVQLIEQITEELFGILLASLVLQTRAIPQLMNRGRLKRRIAHQIVGHIVLLAVSTFVAATRRQTGAGRQCGKFVDQIDHCVDGRSAGFGAQRMDMVLRYGFEQIVEWRTGDECLEAGVHVAVVGAVDEAARS